MRALHCAALLGLGLVVGGCRSDGADPKLAQKDVKVRVECAVDDVDFALRPWRAKAKRGNEVTFDVKGVETAELYEKDPAQWPFKAQSPIPITSGVTKHELRADADPTKSYSYGIRFDCGTDGGVVAIDPDIIIVDAM